MFQKCGRQWDFLSENEALESLTNMYSYMYPYIRSGINNKIETKVCTYWGICRKEKHLYHCVLVKLEFPHLIPIKPQLLVWLHNTININKNRSDCDKDTAKLTNWKQTSFLSRLSSRVNFTKMKLICLFATLMRFG